MLKQKRFPMLLPDGFGPVYCGGQRTIRTVVAG
jgi:hypothetical protein